MASPSPPAGNITWIRVDKPVFDLWGVIVSSLLFTVLLVVAATIVGVVIGIWLARRRQAATHEPILALANDSTGEADDDDTPASESSPESAGTAPTP